MATLTASQYVACVDGFETGGPNSPGLLGSGTPGPGRPFPLKGNDSRGTALYGASLTLTPEWRLDVTDFYRNNGFLAFALYWDGTPGTLLEWTTDQGDYGTTQINAAGQLFATIKGKTFASCGSLLRAGEWHRVVEYFQSFLGGNLLKGYTHERNALWLLYRQGAYNSPEGPKEGGRGIFAAFAAGQPPPPVPVIKKVAITLPGGSGIDDLAYSSFVGGSAITGWYLDNNIAVIPNTLVTKKQTVQADGSIDEEWVVAPSTPAIERWYVHGDNLETLAYGTKALWAHATDACGRTPFITTDFALFRWQSTPTNGGQSAPQVWWTEGFASPAQAAGTTYALSTSGTSAAYTHARLDRLSRSDDAGRTGWMGLTPPKVCTFNPAPTANLTALATCDSQPDTVYVGTTVGIYRHDWRGQDIPGCPESWRRRFADAVVGFPRVATPDGMGLLGSEPITGQWTRGTLLVTPGGRLWWTAELAQGSYALSTAAAGGTRHDTGYRSTLGFTFVLDPLDEAAVYVFEPTNPAGLTYTHVTASGGSSTRTLGAAAHAGLHVASMAAAANGTVLALASTCTLHQKALDPLDLDDDGNRPNPTELWRSPDRGASWERVVVANINWPLQNVTGPKVTPHPETPGEWLALSGDDFWWSYDDGRTWSHSAYWLNTSGSASGGGFPVGSYNHGSTTPMDLNGLYWGGDPCLLTPLSGTPPPCPALARRQHAHAQLFGA